MVAIGALGSTRATMATRTCRDAGLTVTQAPGSGADVSLVVCDDYLDPELAAVNAEHLAAGRPWLLARPSGTALWTGPVFRPQEGPCWACLSKRVAANAHPPRLRNRRVHPADRNASGERRDRTPDRRT
jgi:hypothetical protein